MGAGFVQIAGVVDFQAGLIADIYWNQGPVGAELVYRPLKKVALDVIFFHQPSQSPGKSGGDIRAEAGKAYKFAMAVFRG